METKPLTKRQREIFRYIQKRIQHDYPPTEREIGKHFGFSQKAAHDHLCAIEKKKYIHRDPGKPRGIFILREDSETQTDIRIRLQGEHAHPLLAEIPHDLTGLPIFRATEARDPDHRDGVPLVAAGTPPLPRQNVKLTKRQQEIFTYLQKRIQQGDPPTAPEIGLEFGFSDNRGREHLIALEKKKYIRREKEKKRAIALVKETDPKKEHTALLPIFGKVAAGAPIFASQNIEALLLIPKQVVNGHECFALRIIGSSMTGVGISEGDFVIVRKQSTADPGDIVVALVEDEATIKRFFLDGDQVRLQPENPAIEPSIFDVKNVRILGKVIGMRSERSPEYQPL